MRSYANKQQATSNKQHTYTKIKSQVGIDLCYVETRIVQISSCICVRYDAGICRHKMEHTGVLVVYE